MTWCRSSDLYRALPWRKQKQVSRPGLTRVGPMGAGSDDKIQWEFRRGVVLTEREKKRVMAEVLRLSVELMYSTHIYSFGGKSYKPRKGGPIGLRSMCALARVVMGRWDCKWKKRMVSNNIKVEDDGRFVDDACVFIYPIRPEWRWENGGLWFRMEWKLDNALLSPTERTKRVEGESMSGLTKCLTFTTETSEEFADGLLPTLGFKLRVNKENIIEYCFYEKPTASNRFLQAETALNHNLM
jgi:hypothetical protein